MLITIRTQGSFKDTTAISNECTSWKMCRCINEERKVLMCTLPRVHLQDIGVTGMPLGRVSIIVQDEYSIGCCSAVAA